MGDMAGEAFVQAIQSVAVTLRVGPHGEALIIAKALLASKSENFAPFLSKPDLTELVLPGIGVAVTKIFICWCYQDRIPPLDKPSWEARTQFKELVIDLWLFENHYSVSALQNQVMRQLMSNTVFGTPSCLSKEDIEYVWSRYSTTSLEHLKNLLVLTLVAQLEAKESSTSIHDFEDLGALPDFMCMQYKAQRNWFTFQLLASYVAKWKVKVAVMVEEKARTVDAAPAVAKKKAVGFAKGEVIVIDD
ncbi:hypothetical protein LTR78_004271 [Recurvomyces mirabilis]|uniref:BTB domain-containing protein n=1 Tax=Recurvomyces mirabilis TaxID=574656 RepID=A0AAE1C301_9PEZI|nr:hypothetical protein LTR78_004271 [Recurvomyces mirabilis]KAK5153558.1 hypothetical protein LTS14_007252 [Recurvomyces mirabilis]